MKSKLFIGLLGISFSIYGQVNNLRVLGVTSTSGIIAYTAPDNGDCIVEVSENPSYTPVVNDVNASLFTAANFDFVDLAGSLDRYKVIGNNTVEQGLDGNYYSRALQQDTLHYVRVTCNSISAVTTFRTKVIPWGDHSPDWYDVNNGKPVFPTVSFTNNQTFIDKNTGLKVFTGARVGWSSRVSGISATGCESGTGWTGVCEIINEDGVYASYSGTTQEPLDVMVYSTASWEEDVESLRLVIRGFASTTGETLSACKVDRITDNCEGQTYVSTELPTTIGTVNVPDSLTPGQFWFSKPSQKSETLQRGPVWTNSGSSNVVYFARVEDCNALKVNETLTTGGYNSGGALALINTTVNSKQCGDPIANVTISDMLGLNGNGVSCGVDTFCGYPFYLQNGVFNNRGQKWRVWRTNTNSGPSVSLDRVYVEASRGWYPVNSSGGFHRPCSTIEFNGWYLCNFGTRLYGFNPTTEEFRWLGSMHVYISNLGLGSGVQFCPTTASSGLFSLNNARRSYCNITSTNDNEIYLFQLDYTGNYNQVTASYDGIVIGPQAISAANYTQLGSAIDVQIENFVTANSGQYNTLFKANEWNCSAQSVVGPNDDILIKCGVATGGFGDSPGQDAIVWDAVYRVGSGVIAVNEMYHCPVSRWCTNHSVQDGGKLAVFPQQFQSQVEGGTVAGRGPMQLKIGGSGISACTKGSTCSACPIDSPTMLGHGLVKVSGNVVTGLNTKFSTWVSNNGKITVNGETRTIQSINGYTELTVSTPFSVDVTTWSNYYVNHSDSLRCGTVTFETDSLWLGYSTRAGTVSVTAGSNTVSGSGTNFKYDLRKGDKVRINGEERIAVSVSGSTLTVDSNWNSSASGVTWESAYPDKPVGYVNGNYPVSTNHPRYYGMSLSVGDQVQVPGGERLRLVKEIGSGQWIVERGAGIDGTPEATPSNYSSGTVMRVLCSLPSNRMSQQEVGVELRWDYASDPFGNNPNYLALQTFAEGHSVEGLDGVKGYAVGGKYGLSEFIPDFNGYNYRMVGDVSMVEEPKFSGQSAPCAGNFCEYHPSYTPENAVAPYNRFFYDHNPIIASSSMNLVTTTLTAGVSDVDTVIPVNNSGNAPNGKATVIKIDNEYIAVCSKTISSFTVCSNGRGWGGTVAVSHSNGANVLADAGWHLGNNVFIYQTDSNQDYLRPKHFPRIGISGGNILRDVSGPSSNISLSGNYSFCIAERDGECFSGSYAKQTFVKASLIEPSFRYCSGGETYSKASDLCVFSMGFYANSLTNVRFPTGLSQASLIQYPKAIWARHLGRIFSWPRRLSSLASVRPVAGQRYSFMWGYLDYRTFQFIVKNPREGMDSSIQGDAFVPLRIQVKNILPGSSKVVVEFGYNHTLRCNSRDEVCVANGSSVNEANPYYYPSENPVGISCVNGCSIVVPAKRNRILHYSIVWKDGSENEMGRSRVRKIAIP